MPPPQRLDTQTTRGRRLPLQITTYEDNPIAWNAACEKSAALDSARAMGPRADLRCLGEATELILSIYKMHYASLCNLQYDLTGHFAYIAAAGFESQWLAATVSDRQDHIVEGHVRAAISGLESSRGLCGDITLALLEGNGGEGFLKLLKIYLHDDLSSVPKTPISLPYRGTSGIPTPSDGDGWRAFFDLSRDVYICSVLSYTLDSWEHRPRSLGNERLGKTRSLRAELDDQFMQLSKTVCTPAEFKAMKQYLRSGHAAAVRCCESCGKTESTVKHMQCKNCMKAVDRKTSYCSKQCQKDDWPRHKHICGKKMTLQTAQSTALPQQTVATKGLEISPPQIGPTTSGYKRSPALLAQVHRLNLEPGVDYFLTDLSGESTPMSLTSHPRLQSSFRTIRNQAITTGDRNMVAALGEFLFVFGVKNKGLDSRSPQLAIKQMVLEYGECVRDDIHVLMLRSFYEQSLGVTQVQRHRDGQDMYDVLVSAEERETLVGYLKTHRLDDSSDTDDL